MKSSQSIARLTALVILLSGLLSMHAQDAFRPPAVPLVTSDPYLSIWSEADNLTDDATRHWTHREHPLVSLIRVDGQTFRLMGNDPKTIPALPQLSVQVTPTRSIYQFENTNVHVTLTFMTAALPNDLKAFSMPLTYITWQVQSIDGHPHSVSIYDSTSSKLTVNNPEEKVVWKRARAGKLTTLRIGTEEQPILGSCGDDHRINWGYAYAAALTEQSSAVIGANDALIKAFSDTGKLPTADDKQMPRATTNQEPVMAFAFDFGKVSYAPVARQVIVAYDEIYEIKYFGRKLLPYWKHHFSNASDLLVNASKNFDRLESACSKFDEQLTADARKVGGEKYAHLCALAYRQCAAACGLAVDSNGQPLFFTKENTSNGDIATVDVIFPMSPQWILLSPSLAKASIVPILDYAASWHWKFPNAPHDLGTYPIARGTDDGGEGMPVEESGNMMIMCDAIAQADGNPDFVAPWWPKLTEWAQYLERYGLDPENQLCTDDFMGHLAHNANLSIKAILGLAAYGDLSEMRGDHTSAQKYLNMAREYAKHWVKESNENDHYRLAFDKPNTWSQKYNLVWDRFLDLNVFPQDIARQEVAYYKAVMQSYGVPLDSRTHLTKTDWSVWGAALAEDPADFEALISPIFSYLNETTARSPLVDSYQTDDVKSDGMHARPVVGGIFIKFLGDRVIWQKWASADKQKVGNWVPLPDGPKIKEVVYTAKTAPAVWRYTTQQPPVNWAEPGFDASSWNEGTSGFGTKGTPGAIVNTTWNSKDIWLRREVTLPAKLPKHLQFYVYHDEDIQVYIDGIAAGQELGFVNSYEPLDIMPAAQKLLKPGARITLAVHCRQTEGGQGIDVGIADVRIR